MFAWLWRWEAEREHPGMGRWLTALHTEARLAPAAWLARRDERLRDLLRHAATVPFHRDRFAAAGFDPAADDWKARFATLPVLTRDDVRANGPALLDPASPAATHQPNATGGSTGEPLRFVQDRAYRAAAAALDVWVREQWGVKPWDRTGVLWGDDRDSPKSPKERFYAWRRGIREANAFSMTPDGLADFARDLAGWRPRYLVGYASALEALARVVIERGIGPWPELLAIRSSAETLHPHQRAVVADAFDATVYDFYGSREVNNLAAECFEQGRLHLISTLRHVEITDEHGRPVPDGQPGYVTVTDLTNRTQPFVRYRNGDLAVLSPEPCACPLPSPVLQSLLGRSTDLIRTPAGELVHGEWFTHLFYDVPGIRRFQVEQLSLGHLVVRVVPEPDTIPDLHVVLTKIRQKMGSTVEVTQETVETIPTPPSGKHRFTISRVPPFDA